MKQSIFIAVSIWIFCLVPGHAQATAQIPDMIVVAGQEYRLHSEPFRPYLQAHPSALYSKIPRYLSSRCTASWRGYRADWEIRNKRLYLTEIKIAPCSESPHIIPVKALFPRSPDPKLATWFSGDLLIAQGDLVEYVHGGYGSKYEQYLTLTIKNGIVIGESRHDAAEQKRREDVRWQEIVRELNAEKRNVSGNE